MGFDNQAFKGLLGLNERNLDWVYRYNPRENFPQVDDKIRTKEILCSGGIPVPETLLVVDSFMHLDASLEDLRTFSEFVIKPSRGRAGGGILLLKKTGPDVWTVPSGAECSLSEIEIHIGEILFGVYSFGGTDDRALIEKKIVPDLFFREIYSGGVADIRVILFKGRPVMAMARIPTAVSDGKANLHQGAIGVGVDLETGVLTSGAQRGRMITRHPDTDTELQGRVIPGWSDVLKISIGAAALVDLEYLGVDIVLDEHEGPLILELNARPGLEIQTVNGKLLGSELGRLV